MPVPDHGVFQQVATRYVHLGQFVAEARKGSNLMGIDLLQVGQVVLISIVNYLSMAAASSSADGSKDDSGTGEVKGPSVEMWNYRNGSMHC